MRFKTVFDKICNFNPHDPDFGVNWPEEITELEDLLAEYEYIMLLNLGFDMVTAVRGNALKRASILSDYDHEIDKPEEIYVKINTYRGLLNKAKRRQRKAHKQSQSNTYSTDAYKMKYLKYKAKYMELLKKSQK